MCTINANLALDVGSNSLKLALHSNKYGFIYQIQRKHSISARINVDDIWNTVKEMINELIKKNDSYNIQSICISSFLGWVAVDSEGYPVTEAWTWMDKQVNLLHKYKEYVPNSLFQTTGRVLNSEIAALKWADLKNNSPYIFNKVAKFTTIKDYLNFKLTGIHLIDATHAGYTGLFSIFDFSWNKELLQIFGIEPNKLPYLGEGTDIVGNITSKVRNEVSLPPDTLVILGGPDGAMAMIGGGGLQKNCAVNVMGTTDVLFFIHDTSPKQLNYSYEKRYLIHNRHLIPGLWLSGGPLGMTGGSIDWFLNLFTCNQNMGFTSLYETFGDYAKGVNPGSEGVFFIPALSGERNPTWYSNMRGTLIGVNPEHHKGHLYKALLEGIGYSLKNAIDALNDTGLNIETIYCLGGGTKNNLALQVRSDIFGKTIYTKKESEASILGAAILCSITMEDSNKKENSKIIKNPIIKKFKPNKENNNLYKEYYMKYIEILTEMNKVYSTN